MQTSKAPTRNRVTVAVLIILAFTLVLTQLHGRRVAAQDGPSCPWSETCAPPSKGYVCGLFECSGGNDTCMTVYYIHEDEYYEGVLTYRCYGEQEH